MRSIRTAFAGLLLLAAVPARADITIGAVLSLTGPAAALGIPARNTLELLPPTIAGQPVRIVVLDDASDSTAAARAARRLIETEHADIIFGPSTSASALAVLDAAAASGTPMITLAGCAACIEPPTDARRWAFKMVPNDNLIMGLIATHMRQTGIHTMADFAFSNAFGDAFATAMDASATADGIKPLLTVRYAPPDTSVTAQTLRLLAAAPDAVFVAASGSPASTPIIELRRRGYAGAVYSNPGAATADMLRVGGKDVEGVMLSVCPFLVAEQLEDTNPIKPVALGYDTAYEAKFGRNTRAQTGAGLWDAYLITAQAAEGAIKSNQPGTPAFRAALRDGIEQTRNMVGAQGIFDMSPTNHSGSDTRALVLVAVRDGAWALVK